jgi:hypothetical protein
VVARCYIASKVQLGKGRGVSAGLRSGSGAPGALLEPASSRRLYSQHLRHASLPCTVRAIPTAINDAAKNEQDKVARAVWLRVPWRRMPHTSIRPFAQSGCARLQAQCHATGGVMFCWTRPRRRPRRSAPTLSTEIAVHRLLSICTR